MRPSRKEIIRQGLIASAILLIIGAVIGVLAGYAIWGGV